MKNKLISMTDFVLKINKHKSFGINSIVDEYGKIINYADFLKQPLTLGMFVPVDADGNILEEPETKYKEGYHGGMPCYFHTKQYEEFNKAKENVLFKNSVFLETRPHYQTERVLVMLNSKPTFRIYNEFRYHDGRVEKQYFPNNENLTIEDLVKFDLELTESALKQIRLKTN